jgi:nucleobase:cation symporter-1, NCS1 family
VNATIAPELDGPAGGSISDEPTFESRGIDYIPASERRGKPSDLAWMWAGALFNIEFVVYGALLIGFGLRFWQVAVIILVGNVSYLITGISSLLGPSAGTAGFAIIRAPFGPNGAKLLSAFNWMMQVGYEILGLVIVVECGSALLTKAGVHVDDGVKVVLVVVAASLQLFLPLFGHRMMMQALRWMVGPFIVIFIVLTILTIGKAHLGAGHNGTWAEMFAGLAFVLSSGGFSWVSNASDFSRYLPKDTDQRKIVWAVALGGCIPTALLMLLGAALATGFTGASGVTTMTSAFSGWFAWPYLIFAILQVLAINSLDLYTSGLTLQSIIPTIKRWQCVLLDTVIAGLLTAWAVFDAGFNNFIEDFVLFMLIWLAPWVAIYLLDFFMRRGKYDSVSLLDTAKGLYRGTNGIKWNAIIAQAGGMIAAALCLNAYPAWESPVTKATNGADFSVFAGVLVGGGLYYLLSRRLVAEETRAAELAPDPESAFDSV